MKAPNGFTLIELLVAMLVASLLLVSLSWIVARLGGELRQDRKGSKALALADARTSLTNLLDRVIQDEAHVVEINRKSMAFDIVGPDAADVEHVKLAVEPQGSGVQLVAATQGGRSASGNSPILADVADLAIAGVESEGGEGFSAVRMAVQMQDGAKASLVFPLRSTSGSGCVFDPISMACRPE